SIGRSGMDEKSETRKRRRDFPQCSKRAERQARYPGTALAVDVDVQNGRNRRRSERLIFDIFQSKRQAPFFSACLFYLFSENLFRYFNDIAKLVPLLLFSEDIAVVG